MKNAGYLQVHCTDPNQWAEDQRECELRVTGLLSTLVHSLVDTNTTALLGNIRISGTVFSGLSLTQVYYQPRKIVHICFFLEIEIFIRVQISMNFSPEKLMFFRDIF